MVQPEKSSTGHLVEYDLHIHSSVSDGTLTPRQIIDTARQKKLKGVAITDHDDISIDGIKEYAAEQNMFYTYGIEFSTDIPNLHILGYQVDLHSPALREFLDEQKSGREKAIREMCKKTRALGIPVDFEEIAESSTKTLGRPHLAELMVKKGYTSNIYEAFQKYLKNGKPVFVDYKKYNFLKILDIIINSKGIPVLAHPAMLRPELFYSVFSQAVKNNLAGLEVYYPRHSPDQKKRLKKLAREYNLIITGGSDFHGDIKPDIEIGSDGVNQQEFERFIQLLQQKK
ncbi:MAG: PHP domain-containing protein [bacterium]|nr:PHP domain-containing protein [bacterium]